MNQERRSDWIHFVEKLSVDRPLSQLIPEVLTELCRTFDFDCGFFYDRSQNPAFQLQASYESCQDSPLAASLPLNELLGAARILELSQADAITVQDICPAATPLELRLGEIFHAKSLVLVPVVNSNQRILALVGVANRQGKLSQSEEDMRFFRAVIHMLSNYIKVHLYQEQTKNAQASLEGILDHMGIDVYVNDFNTHEILYVNRSMSIPYGPAEKLLGRRCFEALFDDKTAECDFCPQKKLIDEDGNPSKVYRWDYQRPFDGAWFRVFSAAFRWHDGRMAHVVSSVDISESKRNEEIIRQLALRDYLTGLPNRFAMTQAIDHLLQSRGDTASFYTLFFDLDGFKLVNDTLGHKVGDELLQHIAAALQENPLTQGLTYRYGGDEFVILLESDHQTLQQILDFLEATFSTPWLLETGPAMVDLSIGITHYPEDAKKKTDIIRHADQAMYFSKHNETSRVSYYNQGNISHTPTELY